jgi:hypothetical protein
MTELALIKLTRPETASDTEALLSRIERMERKLGQQVVAPVSSPTAAPTAPQGNTAVQTERTPEPTEKAGAKTDETFTPEPSEKNPEKEVGTTSVSFDQLKSVWSGLFGSLRDVLGARRWAYFREAIPVAVEGNVIVLEVAHDFHYQSLQSDDAVSAIVATRASDLLGGEVGVRFRLRDPIGQLEDVDEVDLSTLETRDESATDPTQLLAAELGAEEVEG